jgi:hypothetical protein
LKSKRLRNPKQNGWTEPRKEGPLTSQLHASNNSNDVDGGITVWSEKGFPISGKLSRKDDFPGTIIYYYEVAAIAMADRW